jgi:hypothetical protein
MFHITPVAIKQPPISEMPLPVAMILSSSRTGYSGVGFEVKIDGHVRPAVKLSFHFLRYLGQNL